MLQLTIGWTQTAHAEQIIRKLRHGDELAAKGTEIEEIARQLDISVPTLYNWRKQYGGMKADNAKEFKGLKNENALLKIVGPCLVSHLIRARQSEPSIGEMRQSDL